MFASTQIIPMQLRLQEYLLRVHDCHKMRQRSFHFITIHHVVFVVVFKCHSELGHKNAISAQKSWMLDAEKLKHHTQQ